MNKQKFIGELSEKLNDISEDNRSEYLEYYSEMIDDRVEDGLSEDNAVDLMGDVENIAGRIITEISLGIEDNVIYTEDHSIIDCTNRYKMKNGKFNFTIKVPEGTNLEDIKVEVTKDYSGTNLFYTNLLCFSKSEEWDSSVTHINAYDDSDYYELITNKFTDMGIGIRLYIKYNSNYYMATDTANNSTKLGNGYWLNA